MIGITALSAFAVFGMSEPLHALSFSNSFGLWDKLDSEQQDIFSQNNIIFYDPTECEEGSSEEGTGEIDLSNNKDYEGNQIWTDQQLKALKANQPFYEKAAKEYTNSFLLANVQSVRVEIFLQEKSRTNNFRFRQPVPQRL